MTCDEPDPFIGTVPPEVSAEGEAYDQGFKDGQAAKLDSALPSPSGEELVERVAKATWEAERSPFPGIGWEQLGAHDDGLRDTWRRRARAAIAALPPSGALGLAREIESLTVGQFFTTSTLSALHAKVRALVALLERREA